MRILCLCMLLVCFGGIKSSNICSRELSRKIRRFLTVDVFRTIRIDPATLPDSCELNSKRDLYLPHENAKTEDSGEWKCGLCEKKFVNEYYLDRHLESHHKDSALETNNTVCLADLCPIFGCKAKNFDYYNNEYYDANSEVLVRKKKFGSLERCSEDEVKENRLKCLDLSNRCFKDERTENKFNQLVCMNLQCVNGRLSGGMKMEYGDNKILFWLLRGTVIFIVLGAVILHFLFTDTNILTYLGLKKRAVHVSKSDEFLSNYLRNKSESASSRWWFFETIADAFRQMKREVVKALKYKGKSS